MCVPSAIARLRLWLRVRFTVSALRNYCRVCVFSRERATLYVMIDVLRCNYKMRAIRQL